VLAYEHEQSQTAGVPGPDGPQWIGGAASETPRLPTSPILAQPAVTLHAERILVNDSADVLIRRAGALDASDVSFDPQDDGSFVAMARVDGVRRSLGTIPKDQAAQVIARCKALAELPAYVIDEVQDGRVDGRPFGIPGDLRLSVLPTVRGQRLALRLPALGALPDPDHLGLDPTIVSELRTWFARPAGLILLCGPTGSGKTTTIHSFLSELAATRPDRQLVSMEDPVERRLAGVVQTEINTHRHFGFPEALAAALRQDADVLVVGEVRDPTTATACVRAALTGHLVVTTLHCGRAADAVPRLLEMGVAAELVLPALTGVVAQRLVRKVHTACSGQGCPDCTGGFRGRQVVMDVVPVDAAARAAWRHGAAPHLSHDLDQQAAQLVATGITNAAEVHRAIQ
jgi:general secretion pathway protein E